MITCSRCKLAKTRVNIVPGRGVIPFAKILCIGEGPGQSEDVLGKAFIGPSGKLLDKLLDESGIGCSNCYFTNVVLCRPCDNRQGINREPEKEEVLACIGHVTKIIEQVNPLAIVLVGKIANVYYGSKVRVPKIHITHTLAILRSGGKGSPLYKDNLIKLERFYHEAIQPYL